jgi:hypothetical protein
MANLARGTLRVALTAFCFGCLFSGSNLFPQVPCKASGMFARAGKLVRMDRSELVLTVGSTPDLQKQQPKQQQQQVVFAIGSCARVDAIAAGETINVVYAKDSNRNTAFRIQRALDIEGSKAENLGVAELVLPPALTNEILDAVGLGTNTDDNASHRLARNFAENRAAGVVTHVSVLSPFETELDVAAQNQASKTPPLRFRLSLVTQVKGILRTGVPVAVYYEEGRSPYTATRVIVNPQ